MPKTKLAVTLDADLVENLDHLVAARQFANRSQAIESAVAEKLAGSPGLDWLASAPSSTRRMRRLSPRRAWAGGAEWPEY